MTNKAAVKDGVRIKVGNRISILGVSLVTFVAIWQGSIARADDSEPQISITQEEKSTQGSILNKIRLRSFSEYMTPAFDNHENYIPYGDGSKLLPTNLFNIVWIDYEIAKDVKVVYWQRSNTNFASSDKGENFSFVPRNPRFALRKVNVFNNPNLTTTYDIYFQPGLAPEGNGAGRNFEFGFRTATSYAFPSSKWSIGAITETTGAIANAPSGPEGSSNLYGWAMPWTSYELNKIFSTQHYMSVAFQHVRGTTGIEPDYPMPFNMQNGIGVNVSEQVWLAAFINNYLNRTPTLANTWVSVWLSLTAL